MRCCGSFACCVLALVVLVGACSSHDFRSATESGTGGSTGSTNRSDASDSASRSPSGPGGRSSDGGGSAGDVDSAIDNGASGYPESGTKAVAESSVAASYMLALIDNARIGSDPSQPNYHAATAPVQLTSGPFASVNLVVDLTSTCYPFSKWATDRPPAGQNWPADCDAFDRNFEVALFDPQNVASPGMELVRAITPFGGPEHIEQDVTDAFNAIGTAPRTLVITIPTESDSAGIVSGSRGGWNVSARLDLTPGTPPRNVLSAQSLLYTSIPASQSGMRTLLPFTLPAGTTSTTIEYRVTGHGGAVDATSGCIGPADEFCQRVHSLTLDEAPIGSITPWRATCSTGCTQIAKSALFGRYCVQNPCGDIQSVNAPRANWCPGSEAPPFVYKPALTPGDHTFAFAISSIAGFWRVSTTVYAYGK